ncbi:hypothetical protein KUCAC02_005963 [Chaenocephalus aceratus]|uniref:Uncharacterized protein n=1 Tax=Chaenocephalus aceratus TaxID=36190 RepID=A0ACB9WRP0_CHAAC|nr:hypothetical protein KUCAC02_005963 [Chaenocephalus aceratus]
MPLTLARSPLLYYPSLPALRRRPCSVLGSGSKTFPSSQSLGSSPSSQSLGRSPSSQSLGRSPSSQSLGRSPSSQSLGRSPRLSESW